MERTNKIGEELLKDEGFLAGLRQSLFAQSGKMHLKTVIEEVSTLLEQLVRMNIQQELRQFMLQNNKVLSEIKDCVQRQSDFRSFDTSFNDLHQITACERKKFETADSEQFSLSIVDSKLDTVQARVSHFETRVKALQDKFDGNLKSLWNVLSETEGAVYRMAQREKVKLKVTAPKTDVFSKSGLFKFITGTH